MCIYSFLIFFFNDTATTEIYTLSLHDALPISDKYGLAASAQDFALTQTFTREFDDLGKLGGLGRAARGFAENVPIFGRTILPFTRTPTNLVHYASERVPV